MACFKSFKCILNTSLTEASLKVLSKWYYTPSRLASIFPLADPLCFRGCQLSGTMAHIWWECPRIHSFWKKMFNLIDRLAGCQIPRTTMVSLNAQIPKISTPTRRLILFILLGAKFSVAKAWKQPKISKLVAKRKIS